MECKTPKNHVVTFHEYDKTHISGKAWSTCSRLCLRCLFGIVFLLILYIPFVIQHYQYLTLEKEFAELKNSWREFDMFAQDTRLDLVNNKSHSASDRNLFDTLLKQGRSRRSHHRMSARLQRITDGLNRLMVRPAVHLRGGNDVDFNPKRLVQRQEFVNAGEFEGVFRWRDENPPSSFFYVRDDNDKIIGVKILTPGLYMVYSQVILSGVFTRRFTIQPHLPENEGGWINEVPLGRADPAYSVDTKRIRSPIKETLLRSSITQDGRGRRYPQVMGSQMYPTDVLNHFGMFTFECDDIIYTSISDQSISGGFKSDEFQAYFGIALINPKYNFFGNNPYGC